MKASRYFSSSSRRSLFGAVSTESFPSNLVVNLPALKASVADGGRVMLGIVKGLHVNKKLLTMYKGPVTKQLRKLH